MISCFLQIYVLRYYVVWCAVQSDMVQQLALEKTSMFQKMLDQATTEYEVSSVLLRRRVSSA